MSAVPPFPSGKEYGPEPPPAPVEEDAPMGAAQPVQVDVSMGHIIFVVTLNVLILVELFIAMYMGHLNRDEFSPVFFKSLFSMLIPTLILAIIVKRWIPKVKQ